MSRSHFFYPYGTSTCSDSGVFFPIKSNDFNVCVHNSSQSSLPSIEHNLHTYLLAVLQKDVLIFEIRAVQSNISRAEQ